MTPLQKVLLYAILPALIAGGFSIAPKIYDILAEPTAGLTYRLTTGPELGAPDGYRKILSTIITNTGKKPLSEVKASLNLPDGRIERHRIVETTGLSPSVQAGEQSVTFTLPTLHPGENLTLTAMVLIPQITVEPEFVLRSKEVLGEAAIDTPVGEETRLDFIGAILTGLSVFFMSLAVMLKLRGGGLPFYPASKQDVLFFIAGRLGLNSISDEMRLADASLTYLRMADILLAHGLTAQSPEKDKAILGLKALLLIRNMARVSREVVISNIKILEGEEHIKEIIELLNQKSVGIDNILELRRQIDKFIENDILFLTS